MNATIVRRLLAGLSACGIAVSIVAYIESLSGTTVDQRFQWVIGLVVGAIAVQTPMLVLERSSVKSRTFYWQGFARGMPRRAVSLVKLFGLIAVAHFVWLFIKWHGGVPVIKDGEFILSSRGRIVKVLTQQQYLMLKAEELTAFAALMIACYLEPMMYWWFPRKHQPGD